MECAFCFGDRKVIAKLFVFLGIRQIGATRCNAWSAVGLVRSAFTVSLRTFARGRLATGSDNCFGSDDEQLEVRLLHAGGSR